MDPDASIPSDPPPSLFSYILSFLLVGVAWGFTTPFIRRAAADFNARQEAQKNSKPSRGRSRIQSSQPGFTDSDAGAETEGLIPLDDGEVRRRSTSRGTNNSREVELNNRRESAEVDGEDLPLPAWRSGDVKRSWIREKIVSVFWTVVNLLRTPAYAVPLVVNLTGSIWFFLLVGKHELSLTVPLANSSAFLFTVLGEWYVERKVIAKETWLGMGLVLGGIALCVHSKNSVS